MENYSGVDIRDCVASINTKTMRRMGKSRAELLEALDREALKALPSEPYEYAEWKRARVAPDYHIEIADHFYSVPSKLIRDVIEVRHQRHGRNLPYESACREPSVLARSQPPHHDCRAYAGGRPLAIGRRNPLSNQHQDATPEQRCKNDWLEP